MIEDMVDTGNSMKKLLNLLSKYDPNSVKGTETVVSCGTPLGLEHKRLQLFLLQGTNMIAIKVTITT